MPVTASTIQPQRNEVWAVLDQAEEWQAFSQPLQQKQDALWESQLAVEGMHCSACANAVERALRSVPGVVSAEVSAASKRVRVVWSSRQARPSQWIQAVIDAGYQPFPLAESDSYARKEQRRLLWRLLVAGFCMMQVMMYTYPGYITARGEMTDDVSSLLRWASWVLTLPVLLFSSGPFFHNAFNDLRNARVSMELPVALGILITFMVSTAATFDPSGWWGREVYFDSLTMFVFFLLCGRWIEARMRNKTAGALDALSRRLPISIERRNPDGSFTRVAIRRLAVADVVRVFPGEAFPGDGVVLEGKTSADEALLTGESRAIAKAQDDRVIAGSHNLSAAVLVKLEQIGAATQYAQIVALMQRVAVEKPRLALLADRLATPFLFGVLLAALVTAAVLWPVDHGRALMTAVAVLIVTCPCALSLATPAAVLTSAGALARQGVLLRQLQALETLNAVDTVIFDKTGTLTLGQIRLAAIDTAESVSREQALQLAASIAQYSLHPASRTLFDAWGAKPLLAVTDTRETPGAGLTAKLDNDTYRLGSALHCSLQDDSSAMRVYLMSQQGWLASFTLQEQIRPDAADVIRYLRSSGKRVLMLSGDRRRAAEAVAAQVGIEEVHAECTPQMKLAELKRLQGQGRQIAMIGDGLNDGPILAGALVSVAMGQSVPLAQAQSDVIIQGGQLAVLPTLFVQAHRAMRVVRQNLSWALVYNAVCIPLAVMGYLPAWLAGLGMASSSLLVILNAARLARIRPALSQG